MRILVLNAHSDSGSFCDRIADAYVGGANLGGHQVEAVALRDLRFDLVLRGGYAHPHPLEPDLSEQQRLLTWCEHLVVVSPNWWWSAPALLKGYIDRVFLPGFAMRYHERFPYVEPLLRGRSARVIYTQNAPRLAGVLFRGTCSGTGSSARCCVIAAFRQCVGWCSITHVMRQTTTGTGSSTTSENSGDSAGSARRQRNAV